MRRSCPSCGREGVLISRTLSACVSCLRNASGEAGKRLEDIHRASRRGFPLPPTIPREVQGAECQRCVNRCRLGEGQRGFCGVRERQGGRIVSRAGKGQALVHWYHDALPTNCVADWVCPGGTGAGYPQWAYAPGPERGYYNLAVFFYGCTFNCLFCQNWTHKLLGEAEVRSEEELAAAAGRSTACVCFFGGDPTPQLEWALAAAHLARQRNQHRPLRICWETNGSMGRTWLDKMIDLSLESGGCVKFDLKAFDRNLHLALASTSNEQTLSNFAHLVERARERREPPLAVASTLLVPGYMEAEEVSALAKFIAKADPETPYSLLGFYPQFVLADLPVTTRRQAQECVQAAREAGLRRVHIGNQHLLA